MNRVIFVVLAGILGITMMVLPILLLTPTYQYGEAPSTEKLSVESKEETGAPQATGEPDVMATLFPSSLTQAGLVVILGLIIAFGASLYVRKKVSPPF